MATGNLETFYQRGAEALQRKNFEYARDMFIQLLQQFPDCGPARKGLHQALQAIYQVKGAPSKVTLSIMSVRTHANLKVTQDPKKRIELAQECLQKDIKNGKIRFVLAQALMELGYAEGALAELEIVVETIPDLVPALKMLATLYQRKGMVTQASETLKKVLAVAPNDSEADKILRDIDATATIQKGFDTTSTYRDVLKDKGSAERLERATHLVRTGEELQTELQDLEKQFGQNPTDAKLARKLADLYYDRKKDYEQARTWYQKAAELNPWDVSLKNRADDCTIRLFDIQIGKLQKVNSPLLEGTKQNKLAFEVSSYERRAKDSPTDMGIRFELARRYYAAGDVDKAVAKFQQSVKDPKRRADSHLHLGICFRAKKMYDIALNQFTKALEGGTAIGEKALLIRYYMACCYADAGDYAKAVAEGKKIMEVDINFKDITQLITTWSQKVKN